MATNETDSARVLRSSGYTENTTYPKILLNVHSNLTKNIFVHLNPTKKKFRSLKTDKKKIRSLKPDKNVFANRSLKQS